MSLRHRKLAEVWQHLEGRHDVANVVREIIGQHSIDATLEEDAKYAEESVQTIIWLKTIFDLQRCFLSGTATGAAECPPYLASSLLPGELIFSTILYLIYMKTKLFSSQTTLMTREFTRPRHILAQTILSGLRLLLLRKQILSANDKRRLQNAINLAWRDDALRGVEHFTVSILFAEILNSLNEPSHEDPYQRERTCANLPTFAAGLYPLDIRPETFVTPLIHGVQEEDWIDAFWVLFDTLWAVECAVTQRYVDLRRESSTVPPDDFGVDADEMLEQLWQARTSLVVSIFHITGPMTPTPSMMDSLAITLLDWNEDLDSFLSRQDSIFQSQRASGQPLQPRKQSYSKNISDLSPYFEHALTSFAEWLSNRNSGYERFDMQGTAVTSNDLQAVVKEWVTKMRLPNCETLSKQLDGPPLPVYIVDCPKLHVIPKTYLEHKLRWCDKWAYESVKENSPTVNWKEGVQCPSCPTGARIKYARIIEPFQHLSSVLDRFSVNDNRLSQYNVGDSGFYDTNSGSAASYSASEGGSLGLDPPSNTTTNISLTSHASQSSDPDTPISPFSKPPRYTMTDSPVSPGPFSGFSERSRSLGSAQECPVSPMTESLNVPIPMAVGSRLSMDLPIPVHTPSIPESSTVNTSASAPPELTNVRFHTPSIESMRSGGSMGKLKAPSRTLRIANSIRRKPTNKEREASPLPKEPSFVFSSAGHSLLLWGKGGDHLVRFDVPSNDSSAIQGCRYDIAGIEAVAAGNHKCAVIAASGLTQRKLVIFNGNNSTPEFETDLEFTGRLSEICIAVSRNDEFVATSLNDKIELFTLKDGIKRVAFHHQINVYELRGGVSHKRALSVARTTSDESIPEVDDHSSGWFASQTKGLSIKEKAEEQQGQTTIVSRRIYFSTDSKRLAVATQLGDHCVYVDVFDCEREPVGTISEHSRSFKMPPWTLNDGDLTSVFYDSTRRCALVTAFLGKEYPVLIPFPGYEPLQSETYSNKIVHTAQSPSGQTFVAVNAMTEIIQFEYTAKGTLSPRKLKKSSSKISTSVFKPGVIALAMPLENTLQIFWVRDGKCMLRSVKIGSGEVFRDYDIRPHYDRLMSRNKSVISRAPSLLIPELDAT